MVGSPLSEWIVDLLIAQPWILGLIALMGIIIFIKHTIGKNKK